MADKPKLYSHYGGFKDRDEKVLQPYTHVKLPAKKFEEKLIRSFNHWLKVPKDKEEEILEISHHIILTYLSLLDDIQDGSISREGQPVAHAIYGVPRTITAATYSLMIALEKVLLLNQPEAVQIFTENMLDFHREQGMEIYWRDSFICPTEDDYRSMSLLKDTGFFHLNTRLLQLYSDCKIDFKPLTELCVLYFQIRDDYCNVLYDEYTERKFYCEDISEGKFSFPMIHAIHSNPTDGNKLLNILRMKTQDVQLKKFCVDLMEKLGSFAYTRKVMAELDKQIRKEIAKLGGNPLLTAFLDEFCDWEVDEKSSSKK